MKHGRNTGTEGDKDGARQGPTDGHRTDWKPIKGGRASPQTLTWLGSLPRPKDGDSRGRSPSRWKAIRVPSVFHPWLPSLSIAECGMRNADWGARLTRNGKSAAEAAFIFSAKLRTVG